MRSLRQAVSATRRRGFAIVTCLLLTVLLLPPIGVQAADLFTSVDETLPQSEPVAADITLRSRVVTIDFAQLQRVRAAVAPVSSTRPNRIHSSARAQSRQPVHLNAVTPHTDGDRALPEPGAILTFNLFDDVIVTGIVEQTAPTFSGGYSLAGHIVGEPLETITLVVNGETVAGTVRTLGGTYRIRSAGAGRYVINEVDLSQLPELCGVEEPGAEEDDLEHPFH